MQKIIFLSIFISITTLAAEPVTDKIMELNSRAKSMSVGVKDPLCTNCDEAAYLYDSCFISSCGLATTETSRREVVTSNFGAILAYDAETKKIYEALKKLYQDSIEEQISTLKLTKTTIEDENLKETDRLKLSVAFALVIEDLKNVTATSTEDGIQFNTEPDLSKYNFPATRKIMSEIYSDTFILTLLKTPLSVAESQLFPGKTRDEVVAFIIKDLEAIKNSPVLNSPKLSRSLRKEILDGLVVNSTPITYADYNELGEGYLGARMVFSHGLFALALEESPNVSPRQVISKLGKENLLPKITSTLETYEKFKGNIEAVAKGCAINYHLSKLNQPTNKELMSFKSSVEAAKNKTSSWLKQNLSAKTSALVAPLIQKQAYEYPMTDSAYKLFVQNLLNEEQTEVNKDLKRNAEQLKASQPEEGLSNIFELANASDPIEYANGELKGFFKLCNKTINFSYNTDANYSLQRKFIISPLTVKEPNNGIGIIIHELGHQVFKEIALGESSTESFQKLEHISKCLNDRHPNTPAPMVKAGKRELPYSKYTEEDFADLFSGEVLMSPDFKNNFACSFLSPASKEDLPTLINSNEKDAHSSYLFRMLHVQSIIEGKIKPACQKYLDYIKADQKFASCWPKTGAK